MYGAIAEMEVFGQFIHRNTVGDHFLDEFVVGEGARQQFVGQQEGGVDLLELEHYSTECFAEVFLQRQEEIRVVAQKVEPAFDERGDNATEELYAQNV